MKKLCFVLILLFFCYIPSLLASTDTCIATGTIIATVSIDIVNQAGETMSSVISAIFTNSVIVIGTAFSTSITFPITGIMTGISTGTITATIINPITGAFSGQFRGVGTGTLSSEYGVEEIVTGDITGTVSGTVICSFEEIERCDGNSRIGLECYPDDCYCVRVCNYATGKVDTVCIKSLSELIGTGKSVRKVSPSELPLCIDFDYSTFPGSYPYPSMDLAGLKDDIENAVREWNCICDLDGECRKYVKVSFTEDYKDFDWDARGTLATANSSHYTDWRLYTF